jgi:hypothetical protein
MSRSDTLSKYKTKITTDGNVTRVVFHSTTVVEFDARTITLRTGGWRSRTTLRKMSQASRQFDLGFRIFQYDFGWFVSYDGITLPFDGDTFTITRVSELEQVA